MADGRLNPGGVVDEPEVGDEVGEERFESGRVGQTQER